MYIVDPRSSIYAQIEFRALGSRNGTFAHDFTNTAGLKGYYTSFVLDYRAQLQKPQLLLIHNPPIRPQSVPNPPPLSHQLPALTRTPNSKHKSTSKPAVRRRSLFPHNVHPPQSHALAAGQRVQCGQAQHKAAGRAIDRNDRDGIRLPSDVVARPALWRVPSGDGFCSRNAREAGEVREFRVALGEEPVGAVGAGEYERGRVRVVVDLVVTCRPGAGSLRERAAKEGKNGEDRGELHFSRVIRCERRSREKKIERETVASGMWESTVVKGGIMRGGDGGGLYCFRIHPSASSRLELECASHTSYDAIQIITTSSVRRN